MIEYHPTFAARIHDLAMMGANETEMSKILGISISTLRAWKERYPEFASALEDGKLQADMKVAGALFKRACGFSVTRWKDTKDGMMQEQIHYPPDVKACTFWLTNRRPDQWKNRIDHEIETPGELIHQISELEAARHIAFALTKAVENRSNDNGDTTDSSKTK